MQDYEGSYYETTLSFGDLYSEWNERSAQAGAEYQSIMADPEESQYYSQYELDRLLYRSQLTVSDLNVSAIDTSSCGYVDVDFSVKISGTTYSATNRFTIRPAGELPTINKIYNYGYVQGSYSFSSGSAVAPDIFDYNTTFTVYDNLVGGDVELVANRYGWNAYVSQAHNDEGWYYSSYDYSVYVYYVVDPSAVANSVIGSYTSMGYYFPGDTSFDQSPYASITYKYNGLTFSKSINLPWSADLVANKAVNRKYTTTYQGIDFSYFIIDKAAGELYRYEFSLYEPIEGEIRQPEQRQAYVYKHYLYAFVVNDIQYSVSRYERDPEAVLTNFTYYDDVLSFQYDGKTFTYDAHRLTELLAYN